MSAGGSKSSSNQRSSAESFIAPNQLPFLNDLYAQAQGQVNPAAAQLAAQGASDFNQQYITAGLQGLQGLSNPQAQIDAQTASLQAGLGQLFREEIQPAIQTNAIAAGQFGGGRQGVAEGVATGQLGQAYTQGVGDIVANANRTSLGALSQIPAYLQQNYSNAIDPVLAGFDPLTRFASILGSPSILQTSQSSGSSSSGGFSFGL